MFGESAIYFLLNDYEWQALCPLTLGKLFFILLFSNFPLHVSRY